MEKVELKSKIDVKMNITLNLSLEEARALDDMVKYGAKAFLEGYYKQLGRSYMQKHEKGVYSLFESVKEHLPSQLGKANSIIETINKLR